MYSTHVPSTIARMYHWPTVVAIRIVTNPAIRSFVVVIWIICKKDWTLTFFLQINNSKVLRKNPIVNKTNLNNNNNNNATISCGWIGTLGIISVRFSWFDISGSCSNIVPEGRKTLQDLFGIQTPQLFRPNAVPEYTGKPKSHANFDGSKYNVVCVTTGQIYPVRKI